LVRKIRVTDRPIWLPIIFHSACTGSETIKSAFDAGGEEYVIKSISSKELLSKVVRFTEASKAVNNSFLRPTPVLQTPQIMS